jgi:hypothetical protein
MSLLFYVVYFPTSILTLFATSNNKQSNYLLLLIIISVIAFFIGIRSIDVGNDTIAYQRIFDAVINDKVGSFESINIEYLFRKFNYLVWYFGGAIDSVILISSLVTFYGVFCVIKRFSIDTSLSFSLFLTFGPFLFFHSGIRQSIAIAIILFSMKYFFTERYKIFLIFVFIAAGFHFTAFFVLSFFLVKVKYPPILLLLMCFLSMILYINPQIIKDIIYTFSFMVPEQYLHFLVKGLVAQSKGLGIKFLFYSFCCIALIYGYSRNMCDDTKINTQVYLLAIFYIVFSNVFGNVEVVNRLAHYLSPFFALALPIFVHSHFRKTNLLFILFLLHIISYTFFLRSMFNDSYNIFS